MLFLQKIQSKYRVVANEDNKLADQVLKLVSDLAELGYDDETEKNLLGILEKTYNAVQANCVTADVAWDKIIKQNQAKKLLMKQEMKERNKRTLEQVKKGGANPNVMDDTKKKEIQRGVATNIEKIGNLVKVDFKDPGKVAKDAPEAAKRRKESPEEYGNRIERVKNSLHKINSLMTELRKAAGTEQTMLQLLLRPEKSI